MIGRPRELIDACLRPRPSVSMLKRDGDHPRSLLSVPMLPKPTRGSTTTSTNATAETPEVTGSTSLMCITISIAWETRFPSAGS